MNDVIVTALGLEAAKTCSLSYQPFVRHCPKGPGPNELYLISGMGGGDSSGQIAFFQESDVFADTFADGSGGSIDGPLWRPTVD